MAAPLIAMAEDGKMSVPEGTVAMLGEIAEPIAIIAVAGPYRSGLFPKIVWVALICMGEWQ